jgi:type IV pilus assembly protein PilB
MFLFGRRTPAPDDSADQYKGRPIGRVLTKMGKVTRIQVMEALQLQGKQGGKLGEILVQLGYITPEDVAAALAAQSGSTI